MSSKLSFGYLYDLRNPPQWRKPWADLYAETLDFITWTESVGFEGAWVPEHHCADDGYAPSPLVMLGAIAARTETIRLGSAIALAPFYHPVRFAEDCAALDILSNGRLELGVAIGYRRREAQAYGVDFSKRGRQTDEFLDIVRRLWAGETVSYDGKCFTIDQAFIMPQPLRGQVPLYIGGFAPKAIDRVIQYGDGYFGNEDGAQLYLEKLKAIGKDTSAARIRIPGLMLVVAKDPDKAMDELAPHFHHVNNAYGQWAQEDRHSTGFGDDVAMKPMTVEAFKKSGMLQVMTPSKAIDMFNKMRERLPVEHYMLGIPPGFPLSKFAEYAELFAREVIPAFR